MSTKITPTHTHDCDKCRFITATYSDHGETYDWYICGPSNSLSIIGRYGNDGPSYWSMDLATLEANLGKPSFIQSANRYAWSERMQIAYTVFSWWRESPEMT